MSFPLIDRALIMLLVLELVIATGGRSVADPPPDPGSTAPCDSKCRERRFFQVRYYDMNTQAWVTGCLLARYRTCKYCYHPDGLCSPNDQDKYADPTLAASCNKLAQAAEFATPAQEVCTSLCQLPLQNNVDYAREAAEQPTTYSQYVDDDWGVAATEKRQKCTTPTGGTMTWKDEKKID